MELRSTTLLASSSSSSSSSFSPFLKLPPRHQITTLNPKPPFLKTHCLNVRAKQASSSSPSRIETKKNEEEEVYDCVVVGAGVSGLCTAQAMATKHGSDVKKVMVTEARDRVGGNITTVQRGEYLWEEGPNSFQPGDPILTMVVRYVYLAYFISLVLKLRGILL